MVAGQLAPRGPMSSKGPSQTQGAITATNAFSMLRIDTNYKHMLNVLQTKFST